MQGKNHPLSHSNGVDSGGYPPQNEYDNKGYYIHLGAITNFGRDFFICKNYPPHNLKFWKILVFEISIFWQINRYLWIYLHLFSKLRQKSNHKLWYSFTIYITWFKQILDIMYLILYCFFRMQMVKLSFESKQINRITPPLWLIEWQWARYPTYKAIYLKAYRICELSKISWSRLYLK